ncbi:helix-turn-helix domain-containing protein [Asanoa siamensis]|uniref:Transcriptional regulator n=1 Tax=Asanoa siamensis TaxID=926357 RepID=A0ABQ4CPM7_9ACTN|nr:helix-turn-helix transcriptional regulator [Asanoa siamensis]GIF73212.1 transcriptional regulator [Asanoa siamensis]
MPSEDHGSTVPRRQLGRYLRRAREDAQVTVKAAADALEWSTPRIWRIENGAVGMRALDVKAMCDLYGASAELTEVLMALARETKAKGWWQSYGDALPSWFELYVGLESAARRIRDLQTDVVPGLLQTKAYAREVIALDHPDLGPEEHERRLAVRMERQNLLVRRVPAPPSLEVIISEAVLMRSLRDRSAMAGQLRHLADANEMPNVAVRLLPFSAGLHRWASGGGFAILDFPEQRGREPEPPTVYSDGPTGALYLDKTREVDMYESIWLSASESALDSAQSTRAIRALSEELYNE